MTSLRLWVHWVLANIAGWTAAGLVAYGVGLFVAGGVVSLDMVLRFSASVLLANLWIVALMGASLILAPALMGLCVGVAQWSVLRAAVGPARSWLIASAAAVPLGVYGGFLGSHALQAVPGAAMRHGEVIPFALVGAVFALSQALLSGQAALRSRGWLLSALAGWAAAGAAVALVSRWTPEAAAGSLLGLAAFGAVGLASAGAAAGAAGGAITGAGVVLVFSRRRP